MNEVVSHPPYYEPWESFLSFVEEVETVHWVTRDALRSMTGMGHLAEVLHASKGPEWQPHIEAAHRLETAALSEIERGMPLHLSHSAVAIWTALESTIPEFLALWLCANKEVLQKPAFSRIRIAVAKFSASDRDMMIGVIDELSRSTASNQRGGIGRFELMLDCCGLSGSLEEPFRRDLFELSNVRNLVVHRFGVADARFVECCPWMGIKIGERLMLSEDQLVRYSKAARNYAASIVTRTKRKPDQP